MQPSDAPSEYKCSGYCGRTLDFPGRCKSCYDAEIQRIEKARRGNWLRKLPERHRDVTWESLPDLTRDDGTPRVATERIAPARKLLEGYILTLIAGPPGEGKSTLAAAHLIAMFDRKPLLRGRWIPAVSLLETTPIEVLGESDAGPSALVLALTADFLVLDDLGQELDGADVGSGLLAQRVGPAKRVLEHRFGNRLPTVITTGLTSHDVARLYGGGAHRRVTDGVAIIGRRFWESRDR